MIKVSILGSGNVAHHLIKAFSETSEVELVQVISRNTLSFESWVPKKIISNFDRISEESDIYIIAISDSAIEEVAHKLKTRNKLVVHTSGSTGIEILSDHNRAGVFYPLQTFTKNKAIDFSTVPLCIETNRKEDLELLTQLAHSITRQIYYVNSQQRKALHVAAVFVCNFVNHLYVIGEEICKEHALPFQILQPLIAETANKISYLNPLLAQTGPAKRKDTEVINRHLDFISDNTQKEIYKLLTKSILDHEPKL